MAINLEAPEGKKERTKKGKQTHENILHQAKELFYTRGYNNTGMTDIAANAQVGLGTLTYYFNRKEDIVDEIINTYFMRLYDFVGENSDKAKLQYVKYCTAMILFYTGIVEDPHVMKFYYEITLRDCNKIKRLMVLKLFSRSALEYFNKTYTEEDMEAYTLAFYGAQKEIFIRYYERELPFKAKKLVKSIVYHMFRLLDVDNDTLKNSMKDGFVFLGAYRNTLPQIL
ncbi:TetR/AcrR family transcriptional regulator [Eubacterium sp. 1001713B170207_170306_E7]|uniref:TetR/AcrR family transcriptional regulator n=1 Tax=Eubacterium sp. 1001713B170207_170306_E7 TaxID=2787097 RepID=UPI0018973B51|nr:TetR/AcrR family transcriptional regulator [Eubacterium sp. 1001713B170207_170306_E7]